MDVPETRYARSGDVHIAYQVFGEGDVDIVYTSGWVSHVELIWDLPGYAQAFERLASFARVIIWDKRGTGLSDPVTTSPTLDERMDDLRAVMDAAGSERAVLFGVSEGGPMSLLFAATYPHRTHALVLYGSAPCFALAPEYEHGWTREWTAAARREIDTDWGRGALMKDFLPGLPMNDTLLNAVGRYQRSSASPNMALALWDSLLEIDARPILSSVRVPTLLLHVVGDRACSIQGARLMAREIPDARLIEIPGDIHPPFFTPETTAMLDDVEEFLTGARHTHDANRVLATVLFTDIVDSTRQAAGLGDRGWRTLLDRHDDAVRRQLRRYRGREVSRTGDGFFATFDGPARAVQCAVSVVGALRPLGLEIRAGVHTGECEVRGDNLSGLAVHIGARIAAEAGTGEILVSRTVKDLVVGSGLRFDDRGERPLKGVPDRWQLFAVSP